MGFCVNCGAQVSGAFCTKCGARSSAGGAPAASEAPASGVPAEPQAAVAQSGALVPRKTNPLVWVVVAVLGLFLLVGIAVVGGGFFLVHKARQAGLDPDLMRNNPGLAVAKLLAATNPDVEVVSVNDGKGTITLRQKSTGKTTTIDFDQAKRGRITFQQDGQNAVTMEAHGEGAGGSLEIKSNDGSMTLGANQGSLPAWIPAYPGSKPQGNFSMSGGQGTTASFTFQTSDAPKDVVAFYERQLKQSGFRITATSTSETGGSSSGLVSAEDDSNRRTVLVTVGTGSEGTAVSVSFQQK